MRNEATNMDARWRREVRSKVRVLWRWSAWVLVTLVAVIGMVATGAYRGPAAASHAPPRRIASSIELPAHFIRAARLTLADVANRYIARMTLDEKLGQLFLADLTGDSYDAGTAAMVEQMHAGGIILYARSIVTKAQTRALVNAAQAHATLPLVVATDEEGGYVDRMQSIYGFRPTASQIGASGSRAFALSEGARVGRDMHSIGLNFDFGPDVDVQLVDGPDQSTRTYGSTPVAVTSLGGAYLTGMQNNGVLACPKHFPGLGAATSDAHLGLPLITRTRAQIEAVELAPYRALFATGQVGAVMSTNLLMPALDPKLPAELSPAIINGVLRGKLGFDGVVVTDALYMDGVAARYDMPEAGVLSIIAGDDLLVGPWTAEQMGAMTQALRDAIQSGRITMSRIDQSVRRILILKMRMGLIPVPLTLTIPVPPLGSMTTVDGPTSVVRLAG
jgi:beta-N-acetylhexosaminidase